MLMQRSMYILFWSKYSSNCKKFVSLKSVPVLQCITHLPFLPIQDGNIFICDMKKMDGIPGRDHDDEPLHVTPGLCLFYLNPEKKLMPIAIQVQYFTDTANQGQYVFCIILSKITGLITQPYYILYWISIFSEILHNLKM